MLSPRANCSAAGNNLGKRETRAKAESGWPRGPASFAGQHVLKMLPNTSPMTDGNGNDDDDDLSSPGSDD